ncbi:MAG: type II 3-dehydroquinate dehydratase [Clostridiaceae bacterium]|nr:type II 3-dehydroquinate dehydratase [Clostridiaceae bacterium]
MLKIRVINGPNLNMLGIREPEIYGSQTLDDITDALRKEAQSINVQIDFFQSNHEGELIDKIHEAYQNDYSGIIINPGAFSHYSYAIRDAISSVTIPCVEVHLSNIYQRDEFRKNSVVAPVCIGQISGFGYDSYSAALYVLNRHLSRKD